MKVKVAQSCWTICDPMNYTVHGILQVRSLLQGIFPTQGSNPGLLHYRQILYQLSHKVSPYIYIHPLFFRFSVHLGHQEHSVKFPVLYNRFSLVVYFLHSSGFYFAYNLFLKLLCFTRSHLFTFVFITFMLGEGSKKLLL